MTADRKALTVGIVNPTLRPLDLPLSIQGAKITGSGTQWQIAGDDPMAYNEPGKPPKVSIKETSVSGVSDKLTVPACSITLLRLDIE